MRAHPAASEGDLSRARAELVNTAALAERARAMGLPRYVRLSQSEERTGGRVKDSILANVFEAVLGALYLDGGLEPVRRLVEREFSAGVAAADRPRPDPKTRLQELLHASADEPPTYRVTDESGPPHEREFSVEVSVAGRVLGRAVGSSKRGAEQEAARRALEVLREECA